MRKVSIWTQIFINCDIKNPTMGLQATENQTSLLPLPTKPLSSSVQVCSQPAWVKKSPPKRSPFSAIKKNISVWVGASKKPQNKQTNPLPYSLLISSHYHLSWCKLFCSWIQTLEAEKVCRMSHLIQSYNEAENNVDTGIHVHALHFQLTESHTALCLVWVYGEEPRRM